MGPIYKQFSDAHNTMHTTMHRHCVLHQLCVVLSQVRCSLDLYFVGGSSKRIGYFDWSRWLSAPELELRQPGISIGAELVLELGILPEPQLWESSI